MGKNLVRDAATAATVAKVNELLRECETILAEHTHRSEVGVYGKGIWPPALTHDLLSVRARLQRVAALMGGAPEQHCNS